MSLGAAVFASVVLVLAVYHKGFRKVLLWAGAIAAALALLAAACYFGYDRYSTWQADREAQREKAMTAEGVKACMLRLGTPMPKADTTPDSFPKDYFNNLKACEAYPDLGIPSLGFVPETLPSGYTLNEQGKVAPLPPVPEGFTDIPPGLTRDPPKSARKQTQIGLEATITCDVIVYDRDSLAMGDPEAIASVHTGDTVKYLGHVTIGNEQIIRVHGRKGYVSGCVDVKQ